MSTRSVTPTFPVWPVRIALVAIVLAIYWPALQFGYVHFDDPEYVYENPLVQRGVTLEGLKWAWTTGYVANWHPITWMSLMIDTNLFGDNPRGHHAMNIALHAVNALLLLGVLTRITAAPWRSALVAGLFAAHPLHVESVAWISERKDVLSMLFWLLAINAYASYARERRLKRYLIVGLWMAMSLMSKPMAVTLPAILLVLDFWPLNRFEAKALSAAWFKRGVHLAIEKMPLLMLSIASAIVTVHVQIGRGTLMEGAWLTFGERMPCVLVSYASYLGKLFWPIDLAALYPNAATMTGFEWPMQELLISGAVLAIISIAALLAIRRAPQLLAGWLWYLVAMIPVIGFVQIGRHFIADRYAYIPFVGLYVMIAWGLGVVVMRVSRRAMAYVVGMLAVTCIIALAMLAHRQVSTWRDSETLFKHAINVTEDNWLMENNLAGVLELLDRRDEAFPHMRRAAEICSDCGWVHGALGEMQYRAGMYYEAQQTLERAIVFDPKHARSHSVLGVVLLQRNQVASAIEHLKRAAELEPTDAEFRMRLAIALERSGRRGEAFTEMSEAIRLAPQRSAEWGPLLESMRAK